MSKSNKVSKKTRYAVKDSSGKIVRDILGHRPAVYTSRTIAEDRLHWGEARGGSRVVRVFV